ncbi:hypothetical protein GQ44DRAFT_816339 [Phaeosphaeriaceae sp. PMI808]|nr:hypothetical protein GQ44DRAFT_816339 [Phaeosphaeriaceae sp. PMI808]
MHNNAGSRWLRASSGVLSHSSSCLLIAHVAPLCNSRSNPEKALSGISVDFERPVGITSSKSTALVDAANKKDAPGIIALLDAGADANIAEDWSQKLPLHIWVETDMHSLAYPDAYLRTLRALLERTSNPEQRDSSGQSVIHMALVGADAAADSDLQLWKQKLNILLQTCPGLGIDDRDEEGKTLLLHVIKHDSRHGWNVLPVIEILRNDFGADIRVRDNENCDFLWHISSKGGLGDERCLHAIQEYLHLFPAEERASVLNASKSSRTKRTALTFMATNAYTKCVVYALDCGADPNIADCNGETALGLSIDVGNRARLSLYGASSTFLKRMPRPDDKILGELFYNGESAYDSSAWAGEEKIAYFAHPKIRDALINAGARTGKQLGTSKIAPDVKLNEEMRLEALGWWESFRREEQPFYDMWKISYDFDDD